MWQDEEMKPERPRREPKQAAPRSEQIDIRTSDGWSLRADVHEPAGVAIGTAVLAHALMARRSEFDRPRGAGVRQFLVDCGWRVVAFDFRGHGDSGPLAGQGATFGYDDCVQRDLPAVFAFARTTGPRKRPVMVVGHSLGGHAALAAQAAELVAFDGVVAVGANVWIRELEPSPARWLVKRISLFAALTLSRRLGRFPARALRLGSDDESCALAPRRRTVRANRALEERRRSNRLSVVARSGASSRLAGRERRGPLRVHSGMRAALRRTLRRPARDFAHRAR